MNEKENYPGKWQGEVPEDFKIVARGETNMTIAISSCLEYLEHLACPVFKPLDKLKVLDPACGTGEALLTMAAKYPQVSFTACDVSSEALALAEQYAEKLELKNVGFLSCLPVEQEFDFILATRPLQHIEDLPGFLKKLQANLAADGLLLIYAYTGSQPEENLYLQERVAEMKTGSSNTDEAQGLIRDLLAQPLKEHIDGLRECNKMMETAGFNLLYGLHPRQYEPVRYVQNVEPDIFADLNRVDQAYLAEQFNGQILRHALLYSRQACNPEMPSFYDPRASKYFPHLSPYIGTGQQEERVIVGLKHHLLLLEEQLEFEDLSLPQDLFRVLQGIDGKKNCEQIHRRFLPMPWERFWDFIQSCWEEEIIYLHRS